MADDGADVNIHSVSGNLSGNDSIYVAGRGVDDASALLYANSSLGDGKVALKPGEQIDKLLNGRLIIQDPKRFMFGIDAVLLSDFAAPEVRFNDSVIDLGTGTGIIPLLMEAYISAVATNMAIAEAKNDVSKTAGSKKKAVPNVSDFSGIHNVSKIYNSRFLTHFTALEVQHESADMAARSVAANNLENRIRIVEGDIKNVSELFNRHSFSVVTTNPPYMISQHGRQNGNDAKTIARHEVLCNLEDVIAAADYLLSPHGKFFMIHRPFRLPEIFASMNAHKIEPKRIRLVQPCEGKEPNIVMIEGRKNANPRLKIEPVLSVYSKPGIYSPEIQEIYKRITENSNSFQQF